MPSQAFYDYARLSEGQKQKMTHKGVIVLQAQVGQPGDVGYIARDTTVGLISAIISYPRSLDSGDLPGRTLGPLLDFDNSLSYGGSDNNISAPMTMTITAPDHAVTVEGTTVVDYINIRNSDRSGTATINVELTIDPDDAVITDAIPVTFKYNTGGVDTVVVATKRWDYAYVLSFDITLPATATGILNIKTLFGALAIASDYSWRVTMYIDDVKKTTAVDTFTVS